MKKQPFYKSLPFHIAYLLLIMLCRIPLFFVAIPFVLIFSVGKIPDDYPRDFEDIGFDVWDPEPEQPKGN